MKKMLLKLFVLMLISVSGLTLLAAEKELPVAGADWKVPAVGMEFVWIKALESWVGKYEVTNGEYRKFKPDHNSQSYLNHSLNGDRQPVVFISFDNAVEYAKWLTALEQKAGRLPDGCRYRLPTRDEWMTFCQCGDGRLYPWGDEVPPAYGNYAGREAGGEWARIAGYNDGFPVSCPVEQSGRNDWGLYGVGGNAWECTVKTTSDLSYDSWRGASWGNNLPVSLQSRIRFISFDPSRYCGFRLVLTRF